MKYQKGKKKFKRWTKTKGCFVFICDRVIIVSMRTEERDACSKFYIFVGIRPSARDDGTASLSLTTARVAEEADPRSAVSVALRANMGGWLGWLVTPSFLFCLCDDLCHRQECSLALCPSPIGPCLSQVSTHSPYCAEVLEKKLECPLQDAVVAWAGCMELLGCPDIKTPSLGFADLGPTERASQYGLGELSCRSCRRVSQSFHQSPVGSPFLIFSLGLLPLPLILPELTIRQWLAQGIYRPLLGPWKNCLFQ